MPACGGKDMPGAGSCLFFFWLGGLVLAPIRESPVDQPSVRHLLPFQFPWCRVCRAYRRSGVPSSIHVHRPHRQHRQRLQVRPPDQLFGLRLWRRRRHLLALHQQPAPPWRFLRRSLPGRHRRQLCRSALARRPRVPVGDPPGHPQHQQSVHHFFKRLPVHSRCPSTSTYCNGSRPTALIIINLCRRESEPGQ